MRVSHTLSVMRRLTSSIWLGVRKYHTYVMPERMLVHRKGEPYRRDEAMAWQPHKVRYLTVKGVLTAKGYAERRDVRSYAELRADVKYLYKRTLKALRKADRQSEQLGEYYRPSVSEFYVAEVLRMVRETRSLRYNLKRAIPVMRLWCDLAIGVRQHRKTLIRAKA